MNRLQPFYALHRQNKIALGALRLSKNGYSSVFKLGNGKNNEINVILVQSYVGKVGIGREEELDPYKTLAKVLLLEP